MAESLRDRLVKIALEWEARFGVAPNVTGTIAEYDAAMLIGHSDDSLCLDCTGTGRTAVTKGCDFTFEGIRYQVKGSRPSGKPGSPVTKLGKASNYDWHRLIWLLYDPRYVLQEAWEWMVGPYKTAFAAKAHIRPDDMRRGRRLA